jgi:hypothetical protein
MNAARSLVLLIGVALHAASCRDFSLAEERHVAAGAGGGSSGASMGRENASAMGGVPAPMSGAAGLNEVGGAGLGGAPHGSAGDPHVPVDAGAAGQLGELGGATGGGGTADGGAASDEELDGPIEPACKLYDWFTPQRSAGLGIAATWFRSAISLYTWDPSTSIALTRWSDSLTPTSWTAWVCLDVVPKVARLTAMNLPNGRPEIFASTTSGGLFVRREFAQTFGPWLPFSVPARDSWVSDVEAVGGELPRVYVVDRGRVYVRSKLDEDSYSDYGPWRGLLDNGASLLAASLLADGTHQVITVDRAGQVSTARHTPGTDEFSAWLPLPSLTDPIVDLVATEVSGMDLAIHALGASGTLWSLSGLNALGWASLDVGLLGVKAEAIAGRTQSGYTQLFAVDGAGVTYRLMAGKWLKTT